MKNSIISSIYFNINYHFHFLVFYNKKVNIEFKLKVTNMLIAKLKN